MSFSRGIDPAILQCLLRDGERSPGLPALRFGQTNLTFGFLDAGDGSLVILLSDAAAAQQIVGAFLFGFCMLRRDLRAFHSRLGHSKRRRGLIIRKPVIDRIDLCEELILSHEIPFPEIDGEQTSADFRLDVNGRQRAKISR